jgi:isoleucyl-tRNA synthetase
MCSLGRAARAKAKIKVRQPVAQVAVSVRSNAPRDQAALRRNEQLILEELNAKSLFMAQGDAALVTYTVKPNLRVLGPRLGSALNEVRSVLATLPPETIESLRRGQPITVAGHELGADDVLLEEHPGAGYAVASEGGYTVAITTTITPELADEGLAREIVRRIQDMRRDAGFDLADRISTWYVGDGDVARVITSHAAYIQGETLSTALLSGTPPPDAHVAEHDLEGAAVTLGVRRN